MRLENEIRVFDERASARDPDKDWCLETAKHLCERYISLQSDFKMM